MAFTHTQVCPCTHTHSWTRGHVSSYVHTLILNMRWRNSSKVKGTAALAKDLGLLPASTCIKQPSLTPVAGDEITSSDLHWHHNPAQTCKQNTYAHEMKKRTLTHMIPRQRPRLTLERQPFFIFQPVGEMSVFCTVVSSEWMNPPKLRGSLQCVTHLQPTSMPDHPSGDGC